MDETRREDDSTGNTPTSADGAAPAVNPAPTGNGNRVRLAELIAQRAYQRFEYRGGEHGHDLEDWLEAERELTSGEEQ